MDKFAGLPSVERLGNGLLRLTEGVSAWLTGEVVSTMDLGTHTLFLASVEDGDLVSNVPSATYAYYHAHIKPKPQSQPSGVKKRWVCRVCGYIYEGETLPEDYICPICRHPASAFDPLP